MRYTIRYNDNDGDDDDEKGNLIIAMTYNAENLLQQRGADFLTVGLCHTV